LDAVVANDLRKVFGEFTAVDGVSFKVEFGTTFALIGPNGAGKTTTLRMVSGLIRPTSGSITVLGGDPSVGGVRSKMSILPEDAGVYEKLTVYESIYYYGLLRGLSRSEAEMRTERLIRVLGLEDKHDEYGSKLSKGLKRKTLLGMCLVNDPQLLVLDEPTDGLDVRSAKNVRDILGKLAGDGKAIIVTSHNMSEIRSVADTIAIMDKGRIVVQGEAEKLLAEYGSDNLEELFLTLTTSEVE
jgi:ABC-type multidrug transport system ATPase subunit